MKKWTLLLSLLLVVALSLPTLAMAAPEVTPPGEFPIVT